MNDSQSATTSGACICSPEDIASGGQAGLCRAHDRLVRDYFDAEMGDRSSVRLRPWGCVNRIQAWNATTGRVEVTCMHGDETPCERTGHETLTTYLIEPYNTAYPPLSYWQDGVYMRVVDAVSAEIDRHEAQRWWRRTRLWRRTRVYKRSDDLLMAAIRAWEPSR